MSIKRQMSFGRAIIILIVVVVIVLFVWLFLLQKKSGRLGASCDGDTCDNGNFCSANTTCELGKGVSAGGKCKTAKDCQLGTECISLICTN